MMMRMIKKNVWMSCGLTVPVDQYCKDPNMTGVGGTSRSAQALNNRSGRVICLKKRKVCVRRVRKGNGYKMSRCACGNLKCP